MAIPRGVDDKSIEALLRAPVVSMSRAGRNDAGHLARRNVANKRGKGSNAHIGGGDGVAVSYMALTSIEAEASGFGRGVLSDDGLGRSEICSSPRIHPEMEMERGKEYEANRMREFEKILSEVPKLQLRDMGCVSQEVVDEEDDKVRRLKSRDSGRPTLDLPSMKEDDEVIQPQVTSVTSPRKTFKEASTASFKSPERFRDPAKHTIMPPVGHYRPKYHGVEVSQTRLGYIQPKGATTARETRKRFDVAPPSEPKTARDGKHNAPQSPTSPNEAKSEAAFDAVSPRKKGPQSDRHSSPAFRSKVPQVRDPLRTAGADEMYWPRNESQVTSPVKGNVNFSKQTSRPPITRPSVGPDASLSPRSDFEGNTHRSPNIGKMTPRRALIPVSATKAAEGDSLVLDRTKADALRFKKATVDVDFGKMAARKTQQSTISGVSVEQVQSISIPNTRSLPVPDFTRMSNRPGPKPASDVVVEGVSFEATEHRVRAALIRSDAQGHGPLFVTPITQNCDYRPNLNVVRPAHLTAHDLSKDTPRKPPNNQSLDLVYDIHKNAISPRLKGDPHLSSTLSRDSRNKVLSPKRMNNDVVYEVQASFDTTKASMAKGYHDMGKKVDRQHVFTGRGMPSDKFQEKLNDGPGPGAYTKDEAPPQRLSPPRRR